jgi:hypothetical protein
MSTVPDSILGTIGTSHFRMVLELLAPFGGVANRLR